MENLPRITEHFGLVRRVFFLVEHDGYVAIVEEIADWSHWWVFYVLQEESWWI
jgi:hypothetical protein